MQLGAGKSPTGHCDTQLECSDASAFVALRTKCSDPITCHLTAAALGGEHLLCAHVPPTVSQEASVQILFCLCGKLQFWKFLKYNKYTIFLKIVTEKISLLCFS